jgi:hypothetical protein
MSVGSLTWEAVRMPYGIYLAALVAAAVLALLQRWRQRSPSPGERRG